MPKFNVLVSVDISVSLVKYMSSASLVIWNYESLSEVAENLNFDIMDAWRKYNEQINGTLKDVIYLKSIEEELKHLILRVGGSVKVADLLAGRQVYFIPAFTPGSGI